MSETSKVVLVTGATGGIGSAVCSRLAHAGYSLILAARDIGKLQAACATLEGCGCHSYRWISVDMSSDASVASFPMSLRWTEPSSTALY